MEDRLVKVFQRIDEINAEDPNKTEWAGKEFPKELIYGERMSEMLLKYEESPSAELQIAARGQHIKRWHIPRKDYPMDRPGYLKWRTMLKLFHGELLSEIMTEEGFDQEAIDKVVTLVTKKKLKSDEESKKLEDVVCLVFLQYYFAAFALEHPEDKIIDIVQKTWGKMTEKGHEMALQLDLGDEELELVKKALS